MLSMDNLLCLASKTRLAIVELTANYGKQISPLPPYKLSGVCGIASYSLYRVYREHKYNAKLACGSFKDWPHAFLICDGFIIDITATQFGISDEVYISKSDSVNYKVKYINEQAIESLKRWPVSKQPFQYKEEIDKLLAKYLKHT
jgi:hypothetical protein